MVHQITHKQMHPSQAQRESSLKAHRPWIDDLSWGCSLVGGWLYESSCTVFVFVCVSDPHSQQARQGWQWCRAFNPNYARFDDLGIGYDRGMQCPHCIIGSSLHRRWWLEASCCKCYPFRSQLSCVTALSNTRYLRMSAKHGRAEVWSLWSCKGKCQTSFSKIKDHTWKTSRSHV